MNYKDWDQIQNSIEITTTEIENLKPNPQGLYTLSYQMNHLQPLLKDNEVRKMFTPVAPVAEIATLNNLQLVRFSNKEFALRALRVFRTKLHIQVAALKNSSETKEGSNFHQQNVSENSQQIIARRNIPDDSSKYDLNGLILYMGNIGLNSSEQEIKKLISEIQVAEWKFYKKPNKFFAFLKFNSKKEAQRAINKFNLKNFKDQPLHLRLFSCNKPEENPFSNRSKNSSVKERNNVRNERLHDSSSCKSQDYRDMKTKMPPLENLVSSDEEENNEIINKDFSLQTTIHEKSCLHLFVGNFPYGTNEEDLMSLFSFYHPVKAFVRNATDRSRSTQAFVCFSNAKDVERAAIEMDHTQYQNHILLVTSTLCQMMTP